MKTAIGWMAGALLVGGYLVANANTQTMAPRMPYQEYASRIKSAELVQPLKSDLFGDSVSLYNGSTQFSATDISIPGNNALPVTLGRRLKVESLPEFARTLGGFGQWDIDVPTISGVFLEPEPWLGQHNDGRRCSQFSYPRNYFPFEPKDFYSGVQLALPGGGETEVLGLTNVAKAQLPADGYQYIAGTRNFDRIRCKSGTANGFPGEGFIVKTANGLTYTLDVGFTRNAGVIEKPTGSWEQEGQTARSNRVRVYLAASRIEDRFGNWVSYQWSGDKLVGITSSDGRAISIGWTGDRITSAAAHGRTWSYSYGADGMRVTLPDSSYWVVNLIGSTTPSYFFGGNDTAPCSEPPAAPDARYAQQPVVTMRHPSGAVGRFEFDIIRHRRSGVPSSACQAVAGRGGAIYYELNIPSYFDVYSLKSKTITGAALGTQVWKYDYEIADGAFDTSNASPCASCQQAKSVWVTAPDNVVTEHRFGVVWSGNDGRLLATYTRDATGKIVKAELNDYMTDGEASNQPFADIYGAATTGDDRTTHQIRPVKATTILQDGDIPAPNYAYSGPPGTPPPTPCPDCAPPPPPVCDPNTGVCDGVESTGPATSVATTSTTSTGTPADRYARTQEQFDGFARPTSTVEASSAGHRRVLGRAYFDHAGYWVLNQVASESVGGTTTSSTTYDARALPWKTYSFGKRQHILLYHADGALASVEDGRGYVTYLRGWKRGIPQTIQHPATAEAPAGALESAQVSDHGWIDWVTDEVGAKTCYAYDGMGRIRQVTHPSETQTGVCDESRWRARGGEFRALTPSDWKPPGAQDGQWFQGQWQGNYRKFTYFDAFWRPIRVHEYDESDVAGTLRVTTTRYNVDGQVEFASYPTADINTATTGTRTFYDELDRVVRVEQDSEHGVLSTTTQYMAGLRTRVRNPRQVASGTGYTENGYVAYAQPAYDVLAWSVMPEDSVVEIGRNAVDRPIALTRRNYAGTKAVTRRYVYDQYMQLCKAIEPETGTTVTDYDAAGNVLWSASGLALSSAVCEPDRPTAYNSGRRVQRHYDARNRLTSLSFPDRNGDQNYTYYADGAVESITTLNDGGANSVVNRYSYNNRRLVTAESSAQPGWYTWPISYDYDADAHLKTLTYPSGLSLSYAVNALGQPKQVTSNGGDTFASEIKYYPNGAINSFRYGNGVIHAMAQNARQLPASVVSTGVANFEYRFDRNGNVSDVYDHARGSHYNRHMYYDGLDRLTSAGSWSFGGDAWHHFTYDFADNIASWKLNGVKDYANYYYQPGTNRLTGIQNSAGATVVGLAYDPQGNLQQKNGKVYSFDFGNRLRTVQENGNYLEGHRYDGHGRRVLAWSPNGGGILSLYSESGQILYEENARIPGTEGRQHIYLAGSLIATVKRNYGAGTVDVLYQHTDALGSPVAVTNRAGQVVERTDWEPYGAAIGKPNYQGVGYTGHVMDGATGLTYMQQRYYDPSIGIFLSVDPIAGREKGDNFNRYSYAFGNPYKFVDPDGRDGIAIRYMERDMDAVGRGEMSREEFYQRSQARGAGAAIGLATVAGGVAVYHGARWLITTPKGRAILLALMHKVAREEIHKVGSRVQKEAVQQIQEGRKGAINEATQRSGRSGATPPKPERPKPERPKPEPPKQQVPR